VSGRPILRGILAVAALALWAGQAAAQPTTASAQAAAAQSPAEPAAAAKKPAPPRDPGRPHAFELTASVLWFAPSSLGARDADLTSNNSSGSPYRLFTASGEFENAAGVEVRTGYRLTKRLAIEGGATFSRPGVNYTITSDVESTSAFTAPGERMSQLFVDASLVAYLSSRGLAGGRLQPFAEAGAGYLQQVHQQGSALSGYYSTDSGQVFHVGGGARYSLGRTKSGAVTGYGLRFDARYYIRNGGFSFGGGATGTFVAGGGLVIAF
jgi:hypothetical protein